MLRSISTMRKLIFVYEWDPGGFKQEGRRYVVSISLCCMQAENKRTFNNHILQIIKNEGAFSTMHTFLVYLQMAPIEPHIVVASLLFQLDLLIEPRKMSIYREESIETLIEALWQKDFTNTQMKTIDALLFLIGYVTASGKSYIEAWVLKIAGFDQPYNALMKAEQLGPYDNDLMETMEYEQKAMNTWQKRVAVAICNHENGSIFQALEECLKRNSLKLAKSCLVLATWLTHKLSTLHDTGVREVAQKCLIEELINVIQSSKNLEEKIPATLALKTLINHPIAHEAFRVYAKSIYRILRKLRKYSVVAVAIMKALLNLNFVDVTELWSCGEVVELDLSSNGEVLSLLYLNGQVLSGHSDGTNKVWPGAGGTKGGSVFMALVKSSVAEIKTPLDLILDHEKRVAYQEGIHKSYCVQRESSRVSLAETPHNGILANTTMSFAWWRHRASNYGTRVDYVCYPLITLRTR